MNSEKLQLHEIDYNLLRTLAKQDLILDLDSSEDSIELAKSFGTTLEDLAQARKRLSTHGFAIANQVTNRQVKVSITPAGQDYLSSKNASDSSLSTFVWWKPWTWFLFFFRH